MISAVILANGKGERFGSTIPKQFVSLNGKPVIQYSIDVLEKFCDEIIIVSDVPYKMYKTVKGGSTRTESARNGFQECKGKHILIHDAVRPYISTKVVANVVDLLKKGELVVDTAIPVVDGYLEKTDRGIVPMDKQGRYLSQTPEGFDAEVLKLAFARADHSYQDEVSMVWDTLGVRPTIVDGNYLNDKITFEQDLGDAEGVLKFRQEAITTQARDKHTLILGGTGGIGSACAKKMKDSVAYGSQDVDLSKEFFIDLRRYEAIIHSAGTFGEKEMEVNFNSCVRLVELAEEQNWEGNIVFLSSTAATFGRSAYPIYSASKAALNAYIEARHEELASKGIYINAIAPARTNTELQRKLNPTVKPEEMIDPDYVADYVIRYTDTKAHGHIIYLRRGLEKPLK
jgi:ribitol-5-phosphate 2-dehydrogenase (NADP+) / D-ribitol-5-phosphate cytidylyltransferase